MFGVVADLLTIATSVLFPIFASYKALRSNDPGQTAPWLMYWTVLSLVTAVETTFDFILGWVPFNSWFRLFLHLWLVLPGMQGATMLFQQYLQPYLFRHERQIEVFISNAHDKAKAAGLNYLNQAIEWVKVNVMGMQPKPPPPPPARGYGSYAEQLLGRFTMPAARQGFSVPTGTGATGDLYGMLAGALHSAVSSGGNRETQARDLSASGTLIPDNIRSPEERLRYVSKQREGLKVLLSAFDREAFNLAGQEGSSAPQQHSGADLTKSRSEVDFEKIETHEVGEGRTSGKQAQAQGGWLPWAWGAKQGDEAGKSSGVDLGH